MVAFTTNFDFPFPDGSDAPCDFAEQWCDFTDAIDAVFARFQTTLDRTVPMIPIALLSLSEAVVIPDGGNIPYDTVKIDSAGWTAVDIDNTLISATMAGVLSLSVNAVFQQVGGPDMFILDPVDTTGVIVEPQLPFATQMDMGTCPIGEPLEALLFSSGNWVPGTSGIRNGVVSNTPPTNTVQESNFAIYWHSDGGTV